MTLAHDQRVIVTYALGLDEPAVQALISKGGRTARRLSGSSAIAASLSRSQIESLEADARVLTISPDRKVVATMDIAVPTIGADRLSQYLGYTGRGVTIAVIDSGLTPSTAVPSRVLASVDFTGARLSNDAFGHGTRAGNGGSGARGPRGRTGLNLVSLRVLDANGQGYEQRH
jgi:serine protease AprX